MARPANSARRRPRWIMRIVSVALAAACGTSGMDHVDAVAAESRSPYAQRKPYEIRASWVDDGRVSPTSTDFDFRTVRFVPGRGIIAAGDRLLLRIDAGVPFITLAWTRGELGVESAGRAVTGLPGGGALFAGYTVEVADDAIADLPATVTTKGYMLGLSDRGWRSEPAPPLNDAASWRFVDLQSTSEGTVYALVETGPSHSREGGVRRRLFARTGPTWAPLACPGAQARAPADATSARTALADGTQSVPNARCPQIRAICVSGVGALWVAAVEDVGATAHASTLTAMYSYRDNLGWTAASLPSGAAGQVRAASGALACGHFGAWLLTRHAGTDEADAPALYHLQEHAPTSRVELPADIDRGKRRHRGRPAATLRLLAVDHSLRPWISVEHTSTPGPTFRLDSTGWHEFSLPEIPGVTHYALVDMAFDERGDGWAVANAASGASTGRHAGLVLYFHDEHWVQRGWSWHWWQERFFGLLGPDR